MNSLYNAEGTLEEYRQSLLKVAEDFQILRGLSSILAMPECIEYELILTLLSKLDLPEAEGKSREGTSNSPKGQTSDSTSHSKKRVQYPLDAILGKHIELKGVFSALLNGNYLETLCSDAETAGIDLTKPHRRVQVESEEPKAGGLGAIVAPRVVMYKIKGIPKTRSLTLVHANFGGEISADPTPIDEPESGPGTTTVENTNDEPTDERAGPDQTKSPAVEAGPYLKTHKKGKQKKQKKAKKQREIPGKQSKKKGPIKPLISMDTTFNPAVEQVWNRVVETFTDQPDVLHAFKDLLQEAIDMREKLRPLNPKSTQKTSKPFDSSDLINRALENPESLYTRAMPYERWIELAEEIDLKVSEVYERCFSLLQVFSSALIPEEEYTTFVSNTMNPFTESYTYSLATDYGYHYPKQEFDYYSSIDFRPREEDNQTTEVATPPSFASSVKIMAFESALNQKVDLIQRFKDNISNDALMRTLAKDCDEDFNATNATIAVLAHPLDYYLNTIIFYTGFAIHFADSICQMSQNSKDPSNAG